MTPPQPATCIALGSKPRIALFGGSFDPPHRGHLAIARAAADTFSLTQVLFTPTARQPLKPTGAHAPYPDRLAMVTLACAEANAHLQAPRFTASTLDAPRPDGRPNYTVDTLTTLQQQNPEAELFAIAGADSFLDLPRWHQRPSALPPRPVDRRQPPPLPPQRTHHPQPHPSPTRPHPPPRDGPQSNLGHSPPLPPRGQRPLHERASLIRRYLHRRAQSLSLTQTAKPSTGHGLTTERSIRVPASPNSETPSPQAAFAPEPSSPPPGSAPAAPPPHPNTLAPSTPPDRNPPEPQTPPAIYPC